MLTEKIYNTEETKVISLCFFKSVLDYFSSFIQDQALTPHASCCLVLGKNERVKVRKNHFSARSTPLRNSYKFLIDRPHPHLTPVTGLAVQPPQKCLSQKSRWDTSSQHQMARWKSSLIESKYNDSPSP